ncbi:L,D-transpeptidase [Budvicia diplopodorum]|uniref:L,D-transpeptidase n=1 Tax=Budvicia diplopodorum TaxID=1119056 RepID=UPI001358D5FC|nr:L,D-transpeptidase [Budvicia diplopodorum]
MLLVKRKVLHSFTMGCTLATLAAAPVYSWATEPSVTPAAAETAVVTTAEVISAVPTEQSPTSITTIHSREALTKSLPAQVTLKYLSELAPIYAASDMKPMWADVQVQKQFEQQLAEMALAGIQPQFGQWAKLLADPEVKGIARDAILSDALVGYMHFVDGVNANGNIWLYNVGSYKLGSPSADRLQQWQQAVQSGELAKFIQSLAPQGAQYANMHKGLKPLIGDAQPWPQLASSKQSLRPGNSSSDIPVLRDILSRSGALSEKAVSPSEAVPAKIEAAVTATTPIAVAATEATPIAQDSAVYTPDLVEGVKRFQQMYGLEADGVIGSGTRDALNMAPQIRAAVLALNIQRLRLLPDTLSTGIFVNIPDFSLVYYVNGERILESKVIVGSSSRKTPLMSSALNNVVVNPPWNVPSKLIREDIMPKAKRDPEYLKRAGYTVYAGWNNGAEAVDSSSIDWSEGSSNYRLQQAPGRGNSLGRFKFNMPNNDAIYLHDTPNHGLFNKSMRALSSGCIRVNKAAELANILLTDAGWDDNKIQGALKRGSTSYAPIREKIPVQLYYMTSWVSANGSPEFRADIYGYDRAAKEGIKELPQVEKLLN